MSLYTIKMQVSLILLMRKSKIAKCTNIAAVVALQKKMRKSCTRNENRIIYNNENLCNKTKEKEGA